MWPSTCGPQTRPACSRHSPPAPPRPLTLLLRWWSARSRSATNSAPPESAHGVAIPHARLREVKKPLALLARLRSPIEFEAVDGQPVDLVFLLLLPASSQLDQLNALAAVARKLRDAEVLLKMRSATSSTELHRAVTEEWTS